MDIASRKAKAAFSSVKALCNEPFVLLSADTEVIFNGAPTGKPEDAADAIRMLRLLSGTTHHVKTGLHFIESTTGEELSQIETTQVVFKKLSDEEIENYVATGEPMDKAGAYGIQGLGRNLVEKITGPFDNVVGLPISLVEKCLRENSWQIERSPEKVHL